MKCNKSRMLSVQVGVLVVCAWGHASAAERLPALHVAWPCVTRLPPCCYCCDDYCSKPLPPVPCGPGCCCDNYCCKPLPPVPCNPCCNCCDNYCPKPLPCAKAICFPWYRCI